MIIPQMNVKTTFLNGELDEEVYMNQPQGFIMPGNENNMYKLIKSLYGLKQTPKQWHQKFKWFCLVVIYLTKLKNMCIANLTNLVDLTKEFLSSKFSMKDIGEADVILVSTLMDTREKLMPNNSQAVSLLEYSMVIGCLMYALTCTRPDIAFAVGKLSSATTLAKAYSQMYNGKSRHLGVKHSMICELIMNGVVSIEFVTSQQNLVVHLTKGLARDLVLKSAEGMSLKSNQVVEC
nr:zinc finger, CCHC-type [Tanacetum cinerariifolium]